MSFDKDDDPVQSAVKQCALTQRMIDITGKQLDGLRTQCKTTEEITQKEIREAETKLIKLVSRQLIAKSRLRLPPKEEMPESLRQYPDTQQWLKIVGLPPETTEGIVREKLTIETLLGMSSSDIRRLMDHFNSNEEDIIKLALSLRNIKIWTERQLGGDAAVSGDYELHWTNYKSTGNSPFAGNSPKMSHRQRPSTSSLPPDTYLNAQSPQSPASPETPKDEGTPASPVPHPSPSEHRRYTPPPTPPHVNKPQGNKGKFPTTPPPQKRNKLYPDVFHPLTKSKSHESQLSMRVNQDDISKYLKKKPVNLTLAGSYEAICKRRRSTESSDAGGNSRGPSGQTSPLMLSPKRSPPYKQQDQVSLSDSYDTHPQKKNQLMVPPISPKTPLGAGQRSMMHAIRHRFTNTFKITTCDYCQKQMFIGYKCRECKFMTRLVLSACDLCSKHIFIGRVCRDCKFDWKVEPALETTCTKKPERRRLKFHRDCAQKVAPSCGMPNEYVDLVIDLLRDGSPGIGRKVSNHSVSLSSADASMLRLGGSVPAFAPPDSSSNTSSCNSSTPSSPVLFGTLTHTPSGSHTLPSNAHQPPPSPSSQPSPSINITDTQFQFPEVFDSIGTVSSLDLTNTSGYNSLSDVVNTNTSNDSDKSDKTVIDGGCERISLLDRGDSQDYYQDDGSGQSWTRVNSISIQLKEWDIPYEELKVEGLLGTGRFGAVHKGKWHGDVAIKFLNMDPESDNKSQLQAFKLEVAMLRKTRHENCVLFMGACMTPPRLAIITSLCTGKTLYWHIHDHKEKFALNRIVIIASQIAQGMGYLHAKCIIHKDLKTKNIFLESGKVIITDFGLFSVTKLCYGNRKGEWLSIPPGWLCYLCPEIMRALQTGGPGNWDLPFSEASDVYAFGTVWYELLCGEWPFKTQPPEAIIWQVGKGMKQSLSGIQASRDVKDLLMLCWSYKTDARPEFIQLLKTLERLPKKRLARSPSHPIQLSRSAESVF